MKTWAQGVHDSHRDVVVCGKPFAGARGGKVRIFRRDDAQEALAAGEGGDCPGGGSAGGADLGDQVRQKAKAYAI